MRSRCREGQGTVVLMAVLSGLTASPGPSLAAETGGSPNVGDGSVMMVENVGQFDPAVRYQLRAGGSTLWVTDDSLWLTRLQDDPHSTGGDQGGPGGEGAVGGGVSGVNLRLGFPGSLPDARPVAGDPQPTRMNYFLGSDPARWRSGVRTFGSVTWGGLYPGISLTLTESDGEPALVIDAGRNADLTPLRLGVTGAASVWAGPEGELVAETAVGPVRLPSVVRDGRRLLATTRGNEVSFGGAGVASGSQDPGRSAAGSGLRYGTFLGGAEDDFVGDMAMGTDGSTYVTGSTYSLDFPTTPGAFDRTYAQGGYPRDAFVSRFSPTGSTLLYSTFLGADDEDTALAIAVGPGGDAYIGGYTSAAGFPTTPGSFDPTPNGGADAFVTHLNVEGSGLIYSTFIGSGGYDGIEALALAENGAVYATGTTLSDDFPTTPGAYDRTLNQTIGLYDDAFVIALDPSGSDLIYGTYLGGRYNDDAYGIALGPGGAAYVTGEAQSFDFPTTRGAYDRSFNGGNSDLFVSRLNATGSALSFSTYIGGADIDGASWIDVGPKGGVFIVGDTASPDYPTTPGAYDRSINSFIYNDAMATKLNRTGTALVYSTFLGGEGYDTGADAFLGEDGALTLTGWTQSIGFPTTPGAFDRTLAGSGDAFVARFDRTGSDLLYSTFLGGSSPVLDFGEAVASAGPGRVVVAGRTKSDDFPTTPGAYDRTRNGGQDAFVASLQVSLA